MTAPQQSGFVVPIQGEHVREALRVARPDIDAFRQAEMAWLQANNSWLGSFIGKNFEKTIRIKGIDAAGAFLAGNALGHYAVRICVGDGEPYVAARDNFVRNLELDKQRIRTPGLPIDVPCWDSEEILSEVFDNADLVASLLEIRHDVARDSAASIIGFFCLANIPHPRPGTILE